MKFRDPKTGEVFDVKHEGVTARFCAHISCDDCPLPRDAKMRDCSNWVIAHPTVAARLMGYEIIEEEPMEQNIKPRICEVLCRELGVEPGEEWIINGTNYTVFANDGCIYREHGADDWWKEVDIDTYAYIIKQKDRIIRKPRFTETEIEQAKAARLLFPDAERVHRVADDIVGICSDTKGWIVDLDKDAFPSIHTGQSVRLSEIVGE